MTYYSQNGQDKFLIEELFSGKIDGVFIEIGANDGITLSNTKALENLGWKGVCVEPLPESFKKLEINRKCTLYNAAISNKTEKIKFLAVSGYAEMLSGILDNYDPRHISRIDSEISMRGGEKHVIEIDSYRFTDLIEEAQIDYISIDTEGSELEVLKSIDFDKYTIKCISAENNYIDSSLKDFLEPLGYEHVKTIGHDEFYVMKK